MNNKKPPEIMGIVNLTEDSFYDGGKFSDVETVIKHIEMMEKDGMNIVDIGAESTRPGATQIDADTEINKILPVLKEIKQDRKFKISIDTYKPRVADIALENGVDIINDIYSLNYGDKSMIDVIKKHKHSKIILMHMNGTPENMQENTNYYDIINEILDFFKERIYFCEQNGISKERIIIDPGLGFGKTKEQNIIIFNNLNAFQSLGLPVLIGASRKSFLSHNESSSPFDRLSATIATSIVACLKGVDIIRVHDVKENKESIDTFLKLA